MHTVYTVDDGRSEKWLTMTIRSRGCCQGRCGVSPSPHPIGASYFAPEGRSAYLALLFFHHSHTHTHARGTYTHILFYVRILLIYTCRGPACKRGYPFRVPWRDGGGGTRQQCNRRQSLRETSPTRPARPAEGGFKSSCAPLSSS